MVSELKIKIFIFLPQHCEQKQKKVRKTVTRISSKVGVYKDVIITY